MYISAATTCRLLHYNKLDSYAVGLHEINRHKLFAVSVQSTTRRGQHSKQLAVVEAAHYSKVYLVLTPQLTGSNTFFDVYKKFKRVACLNVSKEYASLSSVPVQTRDVFP
jgi:hypothetical protein